MIQALLGPELCSLRMAKVCKCERDATPVMVQCWKHWWHWLQFWQLACQAGTVHLWPSGQGPLLGSPLQIA